MPGFTCIHLANCLAWKRGHHCTMKIKSKNTSATGHNARAGEQQALRAAQTRFPASVSRQPMHRERAPECSTEKHELGWVARDLAPVIAQRSVKQQPGPISCDRIKSFTSLSNSECCTGPHLESLTRPQGARRTHKLIEAASAQVEQDVVNCPSCLCAAEPKNTSEQSAETWKWTAVKPLCSSSCSSSTLADNISSRFRIYARAPCCKLATDSASSHQMDPKYGPICLSIPFVPTPGKWVVASQRQATPKNAKQVQASVTTEITTFTSQVLVSTALSYFLVRRPYLEFRRSVASMCPRLRGGDAVTCS